MKKKELVGLASELRRQRDALYKTVADTEADLSDIQEARESEFEEVARDERSARLFARLDLRGKREIEAIDAALARIAEGTYGTCTTCGGAIPFPRLHALPAALCCIACAQKQEHGEVVPEVEEAPTARRGGALAGDFSLMTDREVEASLRELVRDDGRVDTDELRLVSRHGVVYLDGAVPSEAEHQILLKLLTDVAGLREIVDRLQVSEILWERGDRDKDRGAESIDPRGEPPLNDDIVETLEAGADYTAPAEPTSDEE